MPSHKYYEPLTEQEGVDLYFKVQALETFLTEIMGSIDIHIENPELRKELTKAYQDYLHEINQPKPVL